MVREACAVATWRWTRPKPKVLTVCGKSACVQCDDTTRVLDKDDVEYAYVAVADDLDALFDLQLWSYWTALVVIVPGESSRWAVLQPDK